LRVIQLREHRVELFRTLGHGFRSVIGSEKPHQRVGGLFLPLLHIPCAGWKETK
jgi:hypothetical protein